MSALETKSPTPFAKGLETDVAYEKIFCNLVTLSTITKEDKLYFDEKGRIALEVDSVARSLLGVVGSYSWGYLARGENFTTLGNLLAFSKRIKNNFEKIASIKGTDDLLRDLGDAVGGLRVLSGKYDGVSGKEDQLNDVQKTIRGFEKLQTRLQYPTLKRRVNEVGWHVFFQEFILELTLNENQSREKNIESLAKLLKAFKADIKKASNKGLLLDTLFTFTDKLKSVLPERKMECLAEMTWRAFSTPEEQQTYIQAVTMAKERLGTIASLPLEIQERAEIETGYLRTSNLFSPTLLK